MGGQQFFASAGLAEDQDCGIGRGDLFGVSEDFSDGPALSDNPVMAVAMAHFFFEITILLFGLVLKLFDLSRARLNEGFLFLLLFGLGFTSLHDLGDVGESAKPFNDIARIIAHGNRATFEPVISAIAR